MCDCEQWSYFEDQLYRELSIIIEITKHDVRIVFSDYRQIRTITSDQLNFEEISLYDSVAISI